jgi:hypothetical protein
MIEGVERILQQREPEHRAAPFAPGHGNQQERAKG